MLDTVTRSLTRDLSSHWNSFLKCKAKLMNELKLLVDKKFNWQLF